MLGTMFGIVDFIGYAIAFLSIIIGIVLYYKSKTSKKEMEHKLELKQKELDKQFESFNKTSKSIRDIATSRLYYVKTLATDYSGASEQRTSLIDALNSIQKICATHESLQSGESVPGAYLSEIENFEKVTDIWLTSLDLRQSNTDNTLLKSVAENLRKGKKYHYFYAKDFIDADDVDKFRESILTHLDENERTAITNNNALTIIPLCPKKYKHYLSFGNTAIYEQNSIPKIKAAFAEIIISGKDRGSEWTSLPNSDAMATLNILKQVKS